MDRTEASRDRETWLAAGRKFSIRTYGCQMNVHDSEKLANLLFHEGYTLTAEEAEADLLVINTCSIREKAEHHLYSDLGKLREWKAARPDRLLGVGGCVAQQEGDVVLKRFPHLDFVFGTHNLRVVPAMLRSAQRGQRGTRVEETRSLERFDFPERHASFEFPNPRRAYLTVMEGCDMFCSYCIVPRTRGREISRPAQGILEEARTLAGQGVEELILLGQTVNAYGRHDVKRGREATAGTMGFASLLRELAAIPGIAQLRYTSPHPLFFDQALIAAHGELEALCPHVHLPLQSGSNRTLDAMRRRYTVEAYLTIVEGLRRARPDINISTDLIVAYPGETNSDFEATLDAMREARFVDSYSFKFSPRPGTEAARVAAQVVPEVARDRLQRLQGLQRELKTCAHRARVGDETRVRLEGESRRGGGQWRGRDPYHRVVNLDVSGASRPPVAGERVTVCIVEATPHSLIGEIRDPLKTPAPLGNSAGELLTIA